MERKTNGRRVFLVVAISLGMGCLGLVGFLLGQRTADLEKGEIWTTRFAANEVRDAVHALFADRGWDLMSSKGTPEYWRHTAEDAEGREVTVEMTFGFPKSPTRIVIVPNSDYNLREVTGDLARSLGIDADG